MGKLDKFKKASPMGEAKSKAETKKIEVGDDLVKTMREAQNAAETVLLPVNLINRHEGNDYSVDSAEDSREAIENLADKIEREGLLHNLVVSLRADGRYVLISGERRLRAWMVLLERASNEEKQRYAAIPCKVMNGLTPRRELLLLDAANLDVRGAGAGNPERYRKACLRYAENLKEEFGMTQTQAQTVISRMGSASASTIYRIFSIDDGNEKLKELHYGGYITKTAAGRLVSLEDAEQGRAADLVRQVVAQREALSEEFENVLRLTVAELCELTGERLTAEEKEEIFAKAGAICGEAIRKKEAEASRLAALEARANSGNRGRTAPVVDWEQKKKERQQVAYYVEKMERVGSMMKLFGGPGTKKALRAMGSESRQELLAEMERLRGKLEGYMAEIEKMEQQG